MSIPTPSFGSKIRTIIAAQASDPALGARFAVADTGRVFTVYELLYKPGQLDTTRAQDLVDEWNAAKGPAATFSWTPWSASTPETGRFLDDSIEMDVESLVAYGTTVRIMKEDA